MSSRLVSWTIRPRRLVATLAEVWITAQPTVWTPTCELRGKTVGPNQAYAQTIEVAYPWQQCEAREIPPDALPELSPHTLLARSLIPEASLWAPAQPFMYQFVLELWEAGALVERIRVPVGLKHVSLSADGWKLNGKALTVQGRLLQECTELELRQLRADGCHIVACPVDQPQCWAWAARWGVLVLGLFSRADQLPALTALSQQTAALGFACTDKQACGLTWEQLGTASSLPTVDWDTELGFTVEGQTFRWSRPANA